MLWKSVYVAEPGNCKGGRPNKNQHEHGAAGGWVGHQSEREESTGLSGGIRIHGQLECDALMVSEDYPKNAQDLPIINDNGKTSEVKHGTSAYAEVVLVIVHAIVESRHQAIHLDEANREAPLQVQINPASDEGSKGRSCVGGSWIGRLNQRSARVGQANQH